jgi:hypothetical protein
VVERYTNPLIATLTGDIVMGTGVWRINSMLTLASLLSTIRQLSPPNSSGSSADALQCVCRDNLLESVVMLLGLPEMVMSGNTSVSGGVGREVEITKERDELFAAALNLCSEIALLDDNGVGKLVDAGVLSRLTAIPVSYLLNSNCSENTWIEQGSDEEQRVHLESLLYSRLKPLLRLLISLGCGDGVGVGYRRDTTTRRAVIQCGAAMLSKHRVCFSRLLRLHLLSVQGLEFAAGVVHIMTMVACCPFSARSMTYSDSVSLWDSMMIDTGVSGGGRGAGDAYVTDAMWLLRLLGKTGIWWGTL